MTERDVVKKYTLNIALIILFLIFPLLGSGAFADLIGNGAFPLASVVDPVNLFLFGIGLTFVGTRV